MEGQTLVREPALKCLRSKERALIRQICLIMGEDGMALTFRRALASLSLLPEPSSCPSDETTRSEDVGRREAARPSLEKLILQAVASEPK